MDEGWGIDAAGRLRRPPAVDITYLPPPADGSPNPPLPDNFSGGDLLSMVRMGTATTVAALRPPAKPVAAGYSRRLKAFHTHRFAAI
eukprot:SAG31_NODE_6496_length_1995_cov_1.791139_1_plen_86_part_10